MSTSRTFVGRGGKLTMEVVLNGSPSVFTPSNNEAYFMFNESTGDFELNVLDIPDLIDELQGLYDHAHSYEIEEDEEPETVDSSVTPDITRNYVDALERHSDAMEELAHQMSVFDISSLAEGIDVLRGLRDVYPNWFAK